MAHQNGSGGTKITKDAVWTKNFASRWTVLGVLSATVSRHLQPCWANRRSNQQNFQIAKLCSLIKTRVLHGTKHGTWSHENAQFGASPRPYPKDLFEPLRNPLNPRFVIQFTVQQSWVVEKSRWVMTSHDFPQYIGCIYIYMYVYLYIYIYGYMVLYWIVQAPNSSPTNRVLACFCHWSFAVRLSASAEIRPRWSTRTTWGVRILGDVDIVF